MKPTVMPEAAGFAPSAAAADAEPAGAGSEAGLLQAIAESARAPDSASRDRRVAERSDGEGFVMAQPV